MKGNRDDMIRAVTIAIDAGIAQGQCSDKDIEPSEMARILATIDADLSVKFIQHAVTFAKVAAASRKEFTV